MTLQQTTFDPVTGIPRWGCFWLSIVVAAWRTAQDRDPTVDETMSIYNDSRGATTWNGASVLSMSSDDRRELTVNDPSAVLSLALSYTNNGWRGAQKPDLACRVPAQYPRDYRLTYTLVNFKRPSADGHWVLCDRMGMNVVYDPNEDLSIDGWSRTGAWRGLSIWHV